MGVDTDLDGLRKGLICIGSASGQLQSLVQLTASLAAGTACHRFFNGYFLQRNEAGEVIGNTGSSLTIFEENGYSVALGVEVSGRSRPHETCSVSQDMIVALLSDCSVHFEIFRSTDEAGGVFQHDSKVAHHRTTVLRRGEAMFLDGMRDHVLAWSDKPYVFLAVIRKKTARYLAERHDSITGRALYATAANQHLSRLQHVCDYIAHYGYAELVPVLQALSKHPAHFIRWKAAEALLNIDFDAGLRTIFQLCSDSHQHIADAAQLALKQLQRASVACH